MQRPQSVKNEIFALTAFHRSRRKQQDPDTEAIEKVYGQITDSVHDSYSRKPVSSSGPYQP